MTASATICVVRHGETDWNTAGILQGWLDVPLNGTGLLQAHEMAEAMAGSGFTRIYSSPLIRSLVTAAIIADRIGLPAPSIHDGLKERNFGAVQGIPKHQLADLNPLLFQQLLKRNPASVFEQGESMESFAARVLDALMEIGAANAGGHVLVITHGWAMDVITRHIGKLPINTILHMKRKNGECLWLTASARSIEALDIA
jgi:probable phosphoglycerate mutase